MLNIGRIGLDVTLDNPSAWGSSASRGRVDQITGELHAATLAETKALRTELLEQNGQIVPVVWSEDSTVDGFYRQLDADIDAEDYALNDNGLYDFSVTLERIGGSAQTEFQSLLTSVLVVNQHDLLDTEVRPWHSPPVAALAYDTGDTSPTAHTRTTEDGVIPVIIDLDTDVDPTWSVEPVDYYKGGAKITVGGRVRTGLDAPNLPADWVVSNGQIRFKPGQSAGVSTGRILMEVFDGTAWSTSKAFAVLFAGTTVVPKWHYVTIVRNTPEVAILRLVRDAEEAPATTHRHTLDIHLRRGSRYATFNYHFSGGAATWKVQRDSAEATTAITPTGGSSVAAVRATSNDADGDRFVLGSQHDTTQDNTQGGIEFVSTRFYSFFIGSEINGSSAAANDQADALILQYMGAVYEQVRAVPR